MPKPRKSDTVKTIYVLMYIGAIEGEDRWLAPQHIYSMGDAQAAESSADARNAYYVGVPKKGKNKYLPIGQLWYATNTREPIRDETISDGLVSLGAVITRKDIPKTSSRGRYALQRNFVDLLNPDLKDDALDSAIKHWQETHLTASARARVKIGRTVGSTHSVTVHLPQGISRQMDAGLSSEITKAVAEVFAPRFLKDPAVVWISESGNKVAALDKEFTDSLDLNIDAQEVLPDMILVDRGIPFRIVFVEVVATSGPITEKRKADLTEIARRYRAG